MYRSRYRKIYLVPLAAFVKTVHAAVYRPSLQLITGAWKTDDMKVQRHARCPIYAA